MEGGNPTGTRSREQDGVAMLENMDSHLANLAGAYLRYRTERREEDSWAWEEVERQVKTDLNKGWLITRLLIQKSESVDALFYVAAGPLEDIVDIYGDGALDGIEAECRTTKRTQLALSGIWLEAGSPVFNRWRTLMKNYGFVGEDGQPLSPNPDRWFS